MTTPDRPRPVVLCILDGWGFNASNADNAIALAKTPTYLSWLKNCPVSRIDASGLAVGLPPGQMGNSEVGHMTIGAGRVILQDLPRIDQAVTDGSLARNGRLIAFADALEKTKGAVHLMGLMSPGGVHSHQDQLAALANILAKRGLTVWVHAFLDGRDTPPKSAAGFLKGFLAKTAGSPTVRLATVTGRYYAMDRDKRWERIAKAYNALVDGAGVITNDAFAAIEASYAAGKSDEFVEPIVMDDYPGMKDGDGLLMGNFRADRARQILRAFLFASFDGFQRARVVKFGAAAGMIEYSDDLKPLLPALFPPEDPRNTLGEIVANAGLKQLRLAETEKYAHVTFFLNGGREDTFEGEDRILVPSPKVATYDLQPEMSAITVTDKLVAAIESGTYDLIVVNYANPDMVGHTGMLAPAIKAVETIDQSLARAGAALQKTGGVMLLTADHGNIECMRDPQTHEPHTAHTTNLVPCIIVNAKEKLALEDGTLADIAPTILTLMKLKAPADMTGHSLVSGPAHAQ